MAKELDLNRTVFQLTEEYPELIDIMVELGFTEIKKKAMLNSVGKVMTIPKGAKLKQIPMEKIVAKLMSSGFTLTGKMPSFGDNSPFDEVAKQQAQNIESKSSSYDSDSSKTSQLKGYLKRLSEGEDLESVRADFVKEFSNVDSSEIMKAEQELMADGMAITEVQRLCDVHSALFHGFTAEENRNKDEETSAADKLIAIAGHPLYTFTKENKNLSLLLEHAHKALSEGNMPVELVTKIREIAIHYAKKGDLLYPHLKVKYDFSGPSQVMWTVDDEIRDELGDLINNAQSAAYNNSEREQWISRAKAVLQRAEEMIYKEENILFPIAAENFTEVEWMQVYRDSKDYATCLDVEPEIWEAGENYKEELKNQYDGEVVMPGGHMSVEQLTAMLNTVPIEITFVDENNINRYFNEGPKVFKRPNMAIDRDVFTCHPPKIEPIVRAIIDDFREGRKDVVPVWLEKGGKPMLVQYFAVRDKNGKYLGTVEVVQDMEFAKEHFLGKEK